MVMVDWQGSFLPIDPKIAIEIDLTISFISCPVKTDFIKIRITKSGFYGERCGGKGHIQALHCYWWNCSSTGRNCKCLCVWFLQKQK